MTVVGLAALVVVSIWVALVLLVWRYPPPPPAPRLPRARLLVSSGAVRRAP